MTGWRLYRVEDKPSLDALHVQLEARLNRQMDLPDLSERPILIGLVFEREGVITNATCLEAEAEIMAWGETPLSRKDWEAGAKMLSEVCKVYDIRMVRAFVPPSALQGKHGMKLSPVERLLKYFGFVKEDPEALTQFYRWML